MSKTVIISDDHPLFRQALRTAIAPLFSNANIIEVETLAETQDQLADHSVDLLLLDLRMSDSKGLVGLMIIKGSYPEVPVIIVSASEGAETIRSAIQAGASGYISKSASPDQIRESISLVAQGEVAIPDVARSDVSDSERQELEAIENISLLTPTQLKVLVKMTEGMLNKQIAYYMDISEATVKSHVTAIFKKLQVRTRTQAVVLAKQLEVVLSDED
ncbi:MAG: response regulator transcription factor [Acidiferrobacterales bacterium]|nr:response regulator transcription factor [Acidiferrobacterales bacterium]